MKTLLAGVLLSSERPEEVVSEVARFAGDLLDRFRRAVPGARKGQPRAVRSLIRAWRDLGQRVLAECARHEPGLVLRTDEGLVPADAAGRPSRFLSEVLEQEVLHAPFSAWVQARGEAEGIALHMVAALRRLVGGAPLPLPEPVALRLLDAGRRGLDPSGFLRVAYRELESGMPALDRVAEAFDLSDTALARLFGVSRQRIAQWRHEGVPVAHRGRLNAILRLADVLGHNLLPDRIAGIAREPASAFEGRSMLDMIAEGRHEDLVETVRDSFDWATLD